MTGRANMFVICATRWKFLVSPTFRQRTFFFSATAARNIELCNTLLDFYSERIQITAPLIHSIIKRGY